MPQTAKPMAPARIRRLMASAETPEALREQRVREAYAMGALTGLLILAAARRREQAR